MAITDVELDTPFKVKPHPETRPDEVFLTNSTPEDYEKIGWEGKRVGMVPYDTDGKVCGDGKSFFPVFVKQYDLIAAGFSFVK